MFATRSATPLFTLLRQAPRSAPAPSSFLRFQRSTPRSLCTSTPTHTPHATSFLASYRMALAAALPVVALGVGLGSQKPVECASDRSYATSAAPSSVVGGGVPEPAPVESIVNVRDLGFGTVSGICVGVCESRCAA